MARGYLATGAKDLVAKKQPTAHQLQCVHMLLKCVS